MTDRAKVAVYCESYLTSSAANELAASVFGTVVIPFYQAGDAMLRQNIQRLDGKNVLFAIRRRTDRTLLQCAIDYYGVDGIDLESGAIAAEMTAWVASMDKLVIASPSDQAEGWIDALRGTGGRMAWWNLQLYNGADYAAWVGAIAASGAMSSDEAQSFVVPGYKLTWSTPDSVAHDLEGLRDYAPAVDGVFLRSYEQMASRAAEWTKAIGAGLGQPRTILAS